MQPESPLLVVEHFTKTFGSKRAVEDVSITVFPGDMYGFVGHNGAGKTTLIRSIVGVAGFDGGHIFIDGISIEENPLACKAMTAYVPDNPDVYDFLTGMQYLDYIGDIFRVPGVVRRERIEHYAEALSLTAALGDLIASYSHGMKQKVVLMGALLHEPKLLVLVEPFVGLDPEAAIKVRGIMKEMTNRGSAIFFSSHVLEVVEKLCNKVAIIKNGKLVADGPTEEVVGDTSLEDVFLGLGSQVRQ